MDSTLNIEEKEIETKNGSQKVTADVVKITSQDYDNFQEKQLESDIHSDFDKSVTPRDNEDDNDLKIEESETEDFNSEDENTTDLGQNPSKPIEKPCLNNDSSDAERTLKMENPIIIDSSIKTNPSISVENLFTVSENNLKLDIVEGNTIGENSSNAEKASSEEDGLNILYEGEEDKRTEVCLLQDNTKYSEEKNVNEETTSASDLKPENSTADSVSLNESNVNEETTSASDSKTEKSTAECVSPNKSNVNEETTSASDSKTENSTAECVSPNESNVNKRTTTASEFSAENTKADGASLNESQNEFNNQILDIISDIDINIKAQEKITQLKEQELKLIQKQNDLTNKIQKQQILAKQLSGQNQLTQNNCQSRELDLQSQYENEHRGPTSTLYQKNTSSKESTNVSKTVDLRKIFTPATDAAEILPNRKLYASSAFYSPTLHPTVEDQVELARRISHSLSDISNQTSKGQSMYVNRKKRSDKWVHEGRSQVYTIFTYSGNDGINPYKENSETNSTIELKKLEKIPLKLIMNPNGKVRDYNSLKELINVEAGLLSPDNCAELITALQLHQGRDLQQYHQRPVLSPNILPAYSDAGKHRVQLNIHQNQLIERYSKPGLQVVQSPWKAALQTGSASSAFLEDTKDQCFLPPALSPIPYSQTCCKDSTDAIEPMSYGSPRYHTNAIASSSRSVIVPSNPQRDLAYTPCVAQGWGSRNVELPKDSFQCNESESPWQTQTHFGRADDSDHSFNNNIFGESLASNFAFDVQNRLHSLEKFQKYFLDYQRLEGEILRNREGAARELQPEAYESINDLTPQNEFNVLSGEELKANYDLDEKINVRELIESFEKQSTTKLRHVVAPIEGNEGLYVPKEISLSSYAAPPQQCGGHAKHCELSYDDSFSHTLPRTNFSANENSFGNIGIGEFPLSKPLTTGLNIGTPKQEPYSPPSYTKIVPGLEKVKFNQAPLPTENLARYEQPDRRSLTSGSSQYLNALQNSQIRNASPIPFGTSLNEQTSWRPKGLLKGTSLSPLPNQVQTFNKCARGWRSTPVKEQSYSSQYTSPLAGNLPYSDF
ncbi:extracellular matrix-binding protein ebh isoform X5 [Drosophila santomea]|uniref:extracellular matrix-binding protein ebh isoform X5 n=1 Tax=Drosophila santomea TaxID=129105 RepID=UPI001953279E|nr:extracellular matrix-binding protein ebh isoform X5 [Drosophila santomea]